MCQFDCGAGLRKVDPGRFELAGALVGQEAEAVEGVEGKKGEPEVERQAG